LFLKYSGAFQSDLLTWEVPLASHMTFNEALRSVLVEFSLVLYSCGQHLSVEERLLLAFILGRSSRAVEVAYDGTYKVDIKDAVEYVESGQ